MTAVGKNAGGDRPATARSVTMICFILRFTEPGGVTVPATPALAAPWGPGQAHLRLDTDPWGRPHLPGTSLAGALRDMVRAADDVNGPDELFGCLLDAETGGTEVAARASQVWVLGSRPLDTYGTEVRASTAISRGRGAAYEIPPK